MNHTFFLCRSDLLSIKCCMVFEVSKWRKHRKSRSQQIDKAHEIVHKSAHPAIEAVSRRDFDAAKAMYDRAEEARRLLRRPPA